MIQIGDTISIRYERPGETMKIEGKIIDIINCDRELTVNEIIEYYKPQTCKKSVSLKMFCNFAKHRFTRYVLQKENGHHIICPVQPNQLIEIIKLI